MNDPNHCGNCETKCKPNEYCANGQCASTSSCSQDMCEGWCGDFMNDPNHCGNCDTDCTQIATSNGVCKQGQCELKVVTCNPPCNDDQTCQNGKCTDITTPIVCPSPNQVVCNGTCVDPMNSNEYCGANANCTVINRVALMKHVSLENASPSNAQRTNIPIRGIVSRIPSNTAVNTIINAQTKSMDGSLGNVHRENVLQ